MKLSAIGITPQKEKQFNGKGIFSVEDMVRYLPRKYNDFSRETGILPEDQISCLIVTVNKVCTYNNGKPLMIAFCETEDGKRIFVKWFHQNYLAAKYEESSLDIRSICAQNSNIVQNMTITRPPRQKCLSLVSASESVLSQFTAKFPA